MRRMTAICFGILFVLTSSTAFAGSVRERLENSAEVLHEILNVPDGIPQDLLDRAKCVVVMPSVKKLAFGFGGSYGRGAMVCRGGKNFNGPWGAPVMYALEGGSFGFQLGGQASDFIFLIMNQDGVGSLLRSKVKLGADASAAAGPLGRAMTADTDLLMHTEILSYARSRGLFAGVSLQGSTLRPDGAANEDLYRRKISPQEIVDGRVAVPDSGRRLVSELEKASPHNVSG
ncbi:MAG: lipid-binding SYLF domain-containing protein [Acidobacteria bacterium]|nr:lipid-binding SYLF domain-containing protein [Acidobacteriota bacterium]